MVVLAIGLAFLVKWAIDRGTGSLYAGAIITALAVPGLLDAAGVEADGLSTFSFGVAFLFIAAVRLASGGGWGWQLWFGGLLVVVGGVSIAGASFGGYIVPLLLVALGGLLLLRGSGTFDGRRRSGWASAVASAPPASAAPRRWRADGGLDRLGQDRRDPSRAPGR